MSDLDFIANFDDDGNYPINWPMYPHEAERAALKQAMEDAREKTRKQRHTPLFVPVSQARSATPVLPTQATPRPRATPLLLLAPPQLSQEGSIFTSSLPSPKVSQARNATPLPPSLVPGPIRTVENVDDFKKILSDEVEQIMNAIRTIYATEIPTPLISIAAWFAKQFHSDRCEQAETYQGVKILSMALKVPIQFSEKITRKELCGEFFTFFYPLLKENSSSLY